MKYDFQKMDPEVKAKWVAALRSRKYKQGQSYLKIIEKNGAQKHCCLGVLCDTMKIPNKVSQGSGPYEGSRSVYFVFPDLVESSAIIPTGIFGLSDEAIAKLMWLNDINESKFNKIANFIEKHL